MGRKIEAFVSNDDFLDERKAKTMWNYHAELEKNTPRNQTKQDRLVRNLLPFKATYMSKNCFNKLIC